MPSGPLRLLMVSSEVQSLARTRSLGDAVEALSRALPDNAYLTELSLENATVRIVGLAKDAPSLIAPLEHSGAMTGVHFSSPTTREPDGTHFRFHIEGRAEPYNKRPEQQ